MKVGAEYFIIDQDSLSGKSLSARVCQCHGERKRNEGKIGTEDMFKREAQSSEIRILSANF